MSESTSELAVAVQCVPCAIDIAVTAETADEMVECQSAVVDWCKAKIAEQAGQANELQTAYEHAVKRKWKADTLKRHAALAVKRVDFYQRMLTALEHGYQIVPTFPVTAFAIRTNRKQPLKLMTTSYSWQNKHVQEPGVIPAGEGEYQNPFPVVSSRTVRQATTTEGEVRKYWADSWKDLEFPLSMSKPRIMEAATRAMALKIFDDIGILPGYTEGSNARPPKGDPIIVARLKDPRPVGYGETRWVTFIVAWHLDTKTL